MSSSRSAAPHVGRVGALALALGLGVAVATGGGVAWADPGASGSGVSGSGASEQSGPGTGSDSDSATGSARGSGTVSGPGAVSGSDTVSGSDNGSASPAANHRDQLARGGSVAHADGGSAAEPNDFPAVRDSASRTLAAQRHVIADLAVPTSKPAKNDSPRMLTAAASAPVTAAMAASHASTPADVPMAPATEVRGSAVTVRPAAAHLDAVPSLKSVPSAATPFTPFIAPAAVTPPAPVVRQFTTPVVAFASRLLSAVGLGQLAGQLAGSAAPSAPLDSAALWTLLGWARRDAARARPAAATALPSAAVVATQPTTLPSTPIGWVTGQRNAAFPGAGWSQTNDTRWANVYGTDLGIMWFNGLNNKTQLAFGDSFSGPNQSGDWRSNVLLLSDDTNLSNGLTLLNTGPAYQFIPAARNQVFIIGSEVTNIPTSAVFANNNNYVNYMSVKSWDTPGRWTTNYSAISQYNSATDQWDLQTNTIRPAGFFRTWAPYQAGDQNFQQMAYVLQPESKTPPGETRYVYGFGTPAGRAGSAYLSRVPADSVTAMPKYEYWTGTAWVGNQARATEVLGDSTKSPGLFGWAIDMANDPNVFGGILAGFTGAKTGGNISEMSVQYNDHLGKYVALYGNGANNVILRTADDPTGPWSDPITIATSTQYPGLYAPMIHPLSGTGKLNDGNKPDVSNLYWNMSLWGNYNVVLMKTDLNSLTVTTV